MDFLMIINMDNKILNVLCLFFTFSLPLFSQDIYNTPEIRYINGVRVQRYADNHLDMGSYAERKSGYGLGKETNVFFAISNIGKELIDVDPSKITAYYIDKNNNEKPLKIYSYEEYLKKTKRNILWFGPDNVEKATAKTEVKNSNGQVLGTVETKAETYTGANKEAQINAESDISKIYLKRNTLDAGQSMKGIVVIQKAKEDIFYVKVEIDKFTYIFEYELK